LNFLNLAKKLADIMTTSKQLLFFFFFICSIHLFAQPGDTTVVQTYTWEAQNNPNTAYDSPGRRWFNFPPANNGVEYQKILMYYNLKCFSEGTAGNLGFPCGEWDYLTYTYLYQHTGVMDSALATHPQYLINNADFETASLTSQPVVHIQQTEQQFAVIDDVTDFSVHDIANESMPVSSFIAAGTASQFIYLYTADELMNAGLVSGDEIGQLAFYFIQSASTESVQVEVAFTSLSSLEVVLPSVVWTTVYQSSVSTVANDWHNFNLLEPISWDGTSGVLVRVSNNNVNANVESELQGETTTVNTVRSISGTDRYLKMNWQDEVKVPASAFENISDKISISFWQFGDPLAQPQDGTILEGVNAQNQRVLNVHLPWSNSNVYWDAGNDGGYDRINKLANTSNFEGQWNHWCFTKDAAAGTMKIFLNGAQWHVGSNLDNLMEGIARFSIGGATSWSNFYNGSIDEFAVFNVALDAPTIQAWLNKDLDASHPFWSNLQVYYQFNEQNGQQVMDMSGNGHHAWIHGDANRIAYNASELRRNVQLTDERPAIRFSSGNFSTHIESEIVEIPVPVAPVSVVLFDISNYVPVASTITYAWPEQQVYVYAPDGDVLSQETMQAEFTLNNSDLEYWQAPFEIVNRYELNRFITPYGINLTLGPDGWTWIVDVTDFEPLLRDSVELEAGNWQELLDLKFLFIEGPAPRDVLRVERVWDTNQSLSNFDSVVNAATIQKETDEAGWKLLTTNTGHQFDNPPNCAEFCSNIQSVKVNGQQQWNWDIMQECATNPLYPQGGTWIFDRAGWCPGMNSTTKEFELTPFVQGADEFSVDYDIEFNNYGNYVFFGTLIGYGPIKQQHDPEIEMILAPSDWKIHSRWNPMCDNPSFVLRNRGAAPLTDLNIQFGVVGGSVASFHWTGNLGFMESEEVELTYEDPILWQGDNEELMRFFIQLGLSTDGADENQFNNYAESTFNRPPTYAYSDLDDNRLIIQLKTNNANEESSYALYNQWGGVVFERNNFPEPNVIYRDTVQLNSGCYLFHLKDSDDDGLDFFANDDGSGNCKLDQVQGIDFENFTRDFGREIKHYFYWNTNLVSVNESSASLRSLRIFPNPAGEDVQIEATGFDRKLLVRLFDARGALVLEKQIVRNSPLDRIRLNLQQIESGFYTIQLQDAAYSKTVHLIKE
jgi:hypothetical protein